MKYRLSRSQIKTLLEGKPVIRNNLSLQVSSSMKEVLEIIDNNNLYDKYDVFINETNTMDVAERK